MNGAFEIGAVLHHRNFPFDDGTTKNKYLVVLGAKPGCDYLCALTTSKQWKMKSEGGCHHRPRTYFFIPGGGKSFFPKNTWVALHAPLTMSVVEITQKGMTNIVSVAGNLPRNLVGQIRNCLKGSTDLTNEQKRLL